MASLEERVTTLEEQFQAVKAALVKLFEQHEPTRPEKVLRAHQDLYARVTQLEQNAST